jgi:sigma-B regulation protein RsbU (phosphoserine phosphatase)
VLVADLLSVGSRIETQSARCYRWMGSSALSQSIWLSVQDGNDRRAYERELLAARKRAEFEQARAEQLAATLQRSLLPPALSPPPELDAAV